MGFVPGPTVPQPTYTTNKIFVIGPAIRYNPIEPMGAFGPFGPLWPIGSLGLRRRANPSFRAHAHPNQLGQGLTYSRKGVPSFGCLTVTPNSESPTALRAMWPLRLHGPPAPLGDSELKVAGSPREVHTQNGFRPSGYTQNVIRPSRYTRTCCPPVAVQTNCFWTKEKYKTRTAKTRQNPPLYFVA